ncbi:hypothetical protein PYW08_016393 [Mythimna loreyi]|uniref:Uncharacterized protein n=1 Tax=Mythimna loreyi TaxID=667449 RepID=A0ACC2QWV2_9NEOP|nr:hypothetical protein PYW08_016393 [Mythimna loreyi]
MTSKSENEVPLYCSDEESQEEGQLLKKRAPVSPATNNALESFNRIIKDHSTLRERIPLARFLVVAEEMVNSWSLQATEEKFATQPELQLSDWTTGYDWG